MDSDHAIGGSPPELRRREANVFEENDSAISVVVTVRGEAELERENQDVEAEMPKWWELTNVFFSHFSFALLMVDYEGRP